MGAMAEMPMADKVVAQATAGHESEAIAAAAGIRDLALRAQCYERIARVAAQKHSSAAAEALAKRLDTADKLDGARQSQFYGSAIDVHLQLGDAAAAKSITEKGFAVAARIYADDSNSDDPNTALKAFWPSTNAYCGLLRQAARISPVWAVALLKEIEDPEVKVAAETTLAGAWLDAPIGSSMTMVMKKKGHSTSTRPDPR